MQNLHSVNKFSQKRILFYSKKDSPYLLTNPHITWTNQKDHCKILFSNV